MGTFMSTPIEVTISTMVILSAFKIKISTSIVFNIGMESTVLRKVHMSEVTFSTSLL